MSNYLLRLAARSLGILDVVSFRTPSLFEPQPQFQPPLQNGSMIRESMIKSIPLPEDEISGGRTAESQVAGDLIIHSPRIRKSAFYFRPDKFEEASHAASAGVPPSRQKQCSPDIIPGIFAPNSSGRHSQNPAQDDEDGKDGYSRESREGKYGKEGSETLSKAGFQIDPDDRLLSMSEKAHLPPNRADAPPYRSNRSPVADPSLNERESPNENESINENEPLDRNQSRHEISSRGNPAQTDGNPVPDSGPNSSSSTIQPMQRMGEEESLESHRIGSFKDTDLSAPADQKSSSVFPGIESSLPVKRPWKGDDGNSAKEGRAQEDLASRLSETGARKEIESPAVIAEAAVREDAPKQNGKSRDYCIQKILNLQENHGEQLKAFLSNAPVPSQNADLGISDQKHLMPAEEKRPPIDKFHAEETFLNNINPGLHRQRALFRRSPSHLPINRIFDQKALDFGPQAESPNPEALQFRSAAERGSGIIGHGSHGKDNGITNPYRSAATGNALQFSTAHLSAELYLEKQEVEQMDEQMDDGLIPAGLPAPSSSSNPKPSDILKNIQHAEGNSGVIRPGLASEPAGANPRRIAPSIGKSGASRGAPPAKKDQPGLKKSAKIPAISDPQRAYRKTPSVSSINPAGASISARKDIFDGGTFAYPTISKMQAALGGSQMDKAPQVPANQISAPQVFKSQHAAYIRDDASIAASSQDRDVRESSPTALLLNVSPHNASSIILKPPHVSPVQHSGFRTDPSLFSLLDVPSNGVFDLIESNQKRHYIRARLLSPGAKHPPKEAINPGLYEKISHFRQAEAGGRRALSKKKVAHLQNSSPANSAFEDIALPADRSFSGSVRLAEPGSTPKIGDSHAASGEAKKAAAKNVGLDGPSSRERRAGNGKGEHKVSRENPEAGESFEIRKIQEGRRSQDRLERLQNVEREKKMFGIRTDFGREGRIKVTIGRIDVRADIAPESKETRPGAIPASRSSPRLTLDGYLKQRNEGKI